MVVVVEEKKYTFCNAPDEIRRDLEFLKKKANAITSIYAKKNPKAVELDIGKQRGPFLTIDFDRFKVEEGELVYVIEFRNECNYECEGHLFHKHRVACIIWEGGRQFIDYPTLAEHVGEMDLLNIKINV